MNSVLMSLHNRKPEVVELVMRALFANDLSDTEICVLDDNSDTNYEPLKTALSIEPAWAHVRWERYDRGDLPSWAYIQKDDTMNPARVFNKLAQMAQGERLFFMSSDCVVPPNLLTRTKDFDLTKEAYHAQTINGDGTPYCGPKRVTPYGFFLGVSREAFNAIGGYDEEYLRGIAFEDTDFVTRLLRHYGTIAIDCSLRVIHMKHPLHVYIIDGGKGHAINAERYYKTHGNKTWDVDGQYPDGTWLWRAEQCGQVLYVQLREGV